MRFLLLAFGVAFGAIGIESSEAQTREDLTRCRAIEDEARRLVCYDRIELSQASPRSKYETVDLEELKEFSLSFRGRLVEVTGWIDPGEEFLQLGLDEADSNPMPVAFRSLGRSQQQAFFDACGEGCYATVQGEVGPVRFTTGIVAEVLIPH